MSILEQGLPARFFSRRRAVLAGLGIAGAFIIATHLYAKARQHLSEPRKAPICYGDILTAGQDHVPSFGSIEAKAVDERPAASSKQTEQLSRAMEACSTQSCPAKAWNDYRSAIFWYLTPRLQHMSRLYLGYGDAGLIRARRIYQEPLDRKIEQGLKERYAAGTFRINDFRQNREAVAMVVLGSAEALRPCSVKDSRDSSG